jgi:PilZ domain
MKFADSQFAEAVELLQKAGGAKAAKDKRRSARRDIRLEVHIKLNNDENSAWLAVQLRDVSARGVRLKSDHAMNVNDSFLLRLPGKEGNNSVTLLICRVAFCKPHKDVFMVGAEFIGQEKSELPPADEQKELERIRRSILD